MHCTDLKDKWSLFSDIKTVKGYKSLRISSECLSNLFVGVDKDCHHCLILALPENEQINFDSVIKEKISIQYHTNSRLLVLTLLDEAYVDIFDDLIISLYNAIKDCDNSEIYTKVFIQIFYKWNDFFEDREIDRLTKNIIKGLFGELIILRTLIEASSSNDINKVLDSWKGPYDMNHDFVLDQKDIEVKTKDTSAIKVRISSEHQLEETYGKKLELLVVSIDQDSINGYSIKELINDICNLIRELSGDISIFLNAIKQKGLTLKNIDVYDNFRFKPIKQIVYDCLCDNFPRLIKSKIPKATSNIKYDIVLNELKKFMVSEKKF